MARIAVWILCVAVLAGYARAATTESVTGTTGITGTEGTMTTTNTTESSSAPSTNPTEPKSTSKPDTTPQPEIPTFKTPDGQGGFCMIIALNAIVKTDEDEENEEEKSSKVPEDAEVEKFPSECPKDQKEAYIELSWSDKDIDWVLGLYFEATDESYTMTMVNGSYTTANGTMTEWSEDEFDFPEADLGHSIHCKDFDIEPFIQFEEYKFQPFAQESDGRFGEAEECNDESGLDTLWIIVISCAGGVVLLAVLVGLCAVCNKKSKQSQYDKV